MSSPAISACTATGEVPEPISAGDSAQGATSPYAVVGPHSKKHSPSSTPSGFTEPFRVAFLPTSPLAASVVGSGWATIVEPS